MTVHGERIRQARKILRLTQTALADLTEVTQAAISMFESGEAQPTTDVMRQLSAVTGFPVAFFERSPGAGIPLGSLAFRARRYASTKLDQDQAQAWAELIYECCAGLAERVERIPVLIPRLVDEPPVRAAQIARAALGLSPDRPIPNVTNALERAGVIVLALPVPLVGRDAFSSWAANHSPTPLIVVPQNGSDGVRFWLSHELKHLMDYAPQGYLKEVEDAADLFAAEFLMPEAGIGDELTAPVSLANIRHLARRWGVTRKSIVMRAVELKVISARRGQQLFRILTADRDSANEGLPAEKPRLLMRMAEIVYGNPPAPQKLAADYALPLQLASAMLGAHATRSEVVASVPHDDKDENVVRFRPKQS